MVCAVCTVSGLSGCASEELTPLPLLPEPPAYSGVPHPNRMEIPEIASIFEDPKAPRRDLLTQCDQDIQTLKDKAASKEEFRQGVVELVDEDPVKNHWCFYHKVLELTELSKDQTLVREKQMKFIQTYNVLVPMAFAFKREFNDSRYYQWAIYIYRQLSEQILFKQVSVTPLGEKLISGVGEVPRELISKSQKANAPSILVKYGLREPKKVLPPAPQRAVAGSSEALPELDDAIDSDEPSDFEESDDSSLED